MSYFYAPKEKKRVAKLFINGFATRPFFVIQQGSCITIAYNRVGVESVLSLSMLVIITAKCVHNVTIL